MKIIKVSMKDLKERTKWVYEQVCKNRIVIVTKHKKVVAMFSKLSDSDLQLTEKARKKLGI